MSAVIIHIRSLVWHRICLLCVLHQEIEVWVIPPAIIMIPAIVISSIVWILLIIIIIVGIIVTIPAITIVVIGAITIIVLCSWSCRLGLGLWLRLSLLSPLTTT